MRTFQIFIFVVGLFIIAGCNSTLYRSPESVGLMPSGGYPGAGHVCVSLVPNGVTRTLTDKANGLIGCPTHEARAIKQRRSEGFEIVGNIEGWTVLSQNQTTPSPFPDHLKNKTVLFFDSFHKTQLAYFNDNSQEWLWYPGNRSALLGYVQIRGKLICFSYPNSSINPATGVAGPDWECSPLARHKTRIVESVSGDVFNLSSGRIPFVLEKKRYSISELRALASK